MPFVQQQQLATQQHVQLLATTPTPVSSLPFGVMTRSSISSSSGNPNSTKAFT